MEGETDLSREATPTRFQDLSERERKKMFFLEREEEEEGVKKEGRGGNNFNPPLFCPLLLFFTCLEQKRWNE